MNIKILEVIAKILVDTAENHKLVTYTELSNMIDGSISARKLGDPIGELSRISHELGLPLISVMVVNQDTNIPGYGYYKFADDLKGVSKGYSMTNFEKEIEDCNRCEEWFKLLEYFSGKSENNSKVIINKEHNIDKKYWIIVHDMDSFNENSRLIGFTEDYRHVAEIKPGDIIVYYLKVVKQIKGIYKVCDKPWVKDNRWKSKFQISIKPILELEEGIDFVALVPYLETFPNKGWSGCLQGYNGVKELTKSEFGFIEHNVHTVLIKKQLSKFDDVIEGTIPNETTEQRTNRIKRNQKIVCDIKKKYENRCQIEGCGFTFKKDNDEYYSEAHHLDYLSKGGKQDEDNMVILCANHHRMFHYANTKISKRIKNIRTVSINGEKLYIKYI